jgi:hypothetical protein
MRFVEDNQAHVAWAGDYYHTQAQELARKYPGVLAKIEGHALLTTFVFPYSEGRDCFRENNEWRGD